MLQFAFVGGERARVFVENKHNFKPHFEVMLGFISFYSWLNRSTVGRADNTPNPVLDSNRRHRKLQLVHWRFPDWNLTKSANFSLNENPCYKINTPWLDIHLICVSKQFVLSASERKAKSSRHEKSIYNNILPRQADKELWIFYLSLRCQSCFILMCFANAMGPGWRSHSHFCWDFRLSFIRSKHERGYKKFCDH